MANVKFYLDKRAQKQDGTYPLKLFISHNEKKFFVSLNVSIPKENWIGDKIEGDIVNKNSLNNNTISADSYRYNPVQNCLAYSTLRQ
jgi:hypothetical protein